MILFGEYKNGIKNFWFIRYEANKEIVWTLFNKQVYINGTNFTLSEADLVTANVDILNRFFVGGYATTIQSCGISGTVNLVTEMVNEFNKMNSDSYETTTTSESFENGVKKIEIKNYTSDYNYFNSVRYSLQNIFINFSGIKNRVSFYVFESLENNVSVSTSSFRKFVKRIEWEDFDLFSNQNKEVNNSILATRAKTLQQLRLSFDLSWYFDSKGRPKKKYKIINNVNDLELLVKEKFSNIELWSVDVETTGLNCYNLNPNKTYNAYDHIVSLMLSWERDQAIFIPIDMVYMPNIEPEFIHILKPWLEKIPAVGHNISFDGRAILCDYGIELNIMFDTQQLNFCKNCYGAKMRNGLKYLEHKHFNVDTLELSDIFGTKKLAGLFRYLPRELSLIYACPDVDYDLQLFFLLWEQLPTSCRKTFKLDMETMKNVTRMDCIGNRVNIDFAKAYREANNKDMQILEELIYRVVGQNLLIKEFSERLKARMISGEISDEGAKAEFENFCSSNEFKTATRKFKVDSNKELGRILFQELNYPVVEVSQKTGEPAVNAKTFKRLLREVKTEITPEDEYLKQDIKSAVADIPQLAGQKIPPLIKKEDFNRLKYPLALLITEYRLRFKRNSTFFKQLLDENIDGYYFTSSKMANAETFRIINVVQTLQGFMKQMIIPYSDDHYLLVFDFSQIEYRYMAGMANVTELVARLNNYRADFHRECCALLHNIKPWLVTSKMRKEGKSLNFAIPYGMGVNSIAQNLFGVVNEHTKKQANVQLSQWQKSFHQIWDCLEEKRDQACRYGYVESLLGRRRYFYEDDYKKWKSELAGRKKASVRRAAGNFPIQEGAADLFKIAFNRFRARLKKEGLDQLVLTTATVHDELVNSVHKSVNPYFLYKIIMEECMLNIKGHPRYFAGISICDNWHEGKDDLYEAPMEYVAHIVNECPEISNVKFRTFDNPKEQVLTDIKHYMRDVFVRDFGAVGFNMNSKIQDFKNLMDKLEDYFLREKLAVYYPSREKPNKKYENDTFVRALEEFLLQEGPLDEYEIIYPDDYPEGTHAVLNKSGRFFGEIRPQVEAELSNTKTSFFNEDIKKENNDLQLDDNILSLDIDTSLGLDDNTILDDEVELSSVDQLMLLEIEEGDLFGDTSAYYYFDTDLSDNTSDSIDTEDVLSHPEKYIKMYDSFSSNIRISSDKLIINFLNVNEVTREKVKQYLNNYLVTKETLGALEVIIKIGGHLNNTNLFVKGCDVKALQNLFVA